MHDNDKTKTPKKGSLIAFTFLIFLCVLFLCLFTALGIWQINRLSWKNALIAHTNERIHLAPIQAPPQAEWGHVSFDNDEYRPVTINGQFLHDKEILVSTIAKDTTGYWLLTPLQTEDGNITFINRGFVPMDNKEQNTRQAGNPTGIVGVTGLLRMSEGDGFYPRKNNGEKNIWYSRQIPAIADRLGLTNVAPYFIDADNSANQGGLPIGGLTVVAFRNNHLSYAITWFVLAIGVLAAGVFVIANARIKPRVNFSKK